MPYLGNTAGNRFVESKAATQFSGDGSTTAFTLDHAVGSDEDILVSVDGVIQEPSVAYAVSSGTTLTFTAAPSSNSGNNIFVYYLFRTVATVDHPSTSALSATSGTFTGDMTATTGTFSGAVSAGSLDADGGVTVDAITIDGTEIDLSSGDLDIDVAGNIRLDADDSGEIRLLDGGTQYGALKIDSSRFKIQSIVNDADMMFAGMDNNSEITALTLDMSNAGTATFYDNIVMGTAGKGIHLGVTSATASNLLDDYEEGTWTPAVSTASAGTDTVYNASYVKIGKIVTFNVYITWSNNQGNNTNEFRINGLPFTAAASNNNGVANVAYAGSANISAYNHALVVNNTNHIAFYGISGSGSSLQGSAVWNASFVTTVINGFYEVP